MALTFESAKAQVKTGKSCAIRCAHCGELTIADHFVKQVISNVKYQGMEVSSSLSEKGEGVVCRLCGATHQIPASANPVTWEDFDVALASEELIERTNPGAETEVAPPLRNAPRGNLPRPTFALMEYLRANRKLGELLPMTAVLAVTSVVAALIAGNGARSSTGSLAMGWVTGVMVVVVGLAVTAVVNYRQTLDYLADKHGPMVCRFLNDMEFELSHLTDACVSLGSKYAKVHAFLNRIPEFYDV